MSLFVCFIQERRDEATRRHHTVAPLLGQYTVTHHRSPPSHPSPNTIVEKTSAGRLHPSVGQRNSDQIHELKFAGCGLSAYIGSVIDLIDPTDFVILLTDAIFVQA